MIRVIHNFGEKYLTRITLWRSKRFTLYLHIFHQPDPGRDLHNHPWNWCWSACLWGGYTELLHIQKVDRSGLSWTLYRKFRYAMTARKFAGDTYHSIAALGRKHAVTLFAHGPQVREWGFWQRGKHVPWYKYLVDEGINTQQEIDEIRKKHGNG